MLLWGIIGFREEGRERDATRARVYHVLFDLCIGLDVAGRSLQLWGKIK